MTEAVRPPSTRRENRGGIVDAVRPGSLAEEAGIRPGDRVTRIGAQVLRDAVDFQFLASDEVIEVEVIRGEQPTIYEIQKHPDEDLGIDFQDAAFDGVRQCNNACFFCFLKGNPRGMRRTLYVKDDDYRLSFFHGNFVTLTNLTEDDWSRLAEQRLSPLNVSVHATEPRLRRYLLGNAAAPDILDQIRRLGSIGIEVNTQVVLCPGVNDGAALDRTIADLAALHATVRTISVVPVGATDTAEARIARGEHAAEVAGIGRAYARGVVTQVAAHQRRLRRDLGRTLVHLADELYLTAGAPLPASSWYDGFEQYENGIGMARALVDDWRAAVRGRGAGRERGARGLARRRTPAAAAADVVAVRPATMTWVCGTLIAPVLEDLARTFSEHSGVRVDVVAAENRHFGPRVNVSGLLTAGDIKGALGSRTLGDVVVLPRYSLDFTGARFLDDVTPGAVQAELGVPVVFASALREVLGVARDGVSSPVMGAAVAAATNGKSWVDYGQDEEKGGAIERYA